MTSTRMCSFGAAFMLFVASCAPAAGSDDGPDAALRAHAHEWERIVAAEDARAPSPQELSVLLDGTTSGSPTIRAIAVRALGRLERPEMMPTLASSLRDPDPAVRAAAAGAIARTAGGDPDGAAARRSARAHLLEALAEERKDQEETQESEEREQEERAEPIGALIEALGQLPVDSEAEAAEALSLVLRHLEEGRAPALNVFRSLYFMSRQPMARPAFDEPLLTVLRNRALKEEPDDALVSGRIRTLAVATLTEAGEMDPVFLGLVLDDPEPQVRRAAVAALAPLPDSAALRPLLNQALEDDPSGAVRYEALRVYGSRLARERGCAPVRRALTDTDAHVPLLALDLLGTRCETGPSDVERLESMIATLPPEDRWHEATHALLALARIAPELAAAHLPDFETHPDLFVRAHSARAATFMGDVATLRRLASDRHPNVRTEAIRGIREMSGSRAMPAGDAAGFYLAQLSQDDSQLLQEAAAALEGAVGTSTDRAIEGLLRALDRVSGKQRETSRDARRALLVRIGELGDSGFTDRVQPYLQDFDPEIAALAADVLLDWTGAMHDPAPAAHAPVPLPLPTFEEAAALASSRVIIEMADGAEIEIRLLPFVAPANSSRFARLAGDGYFDGLSLHRVVPNFVTQGGSPNANEYTGDGPFSRDELGHPNWRGTVGLSTRGRDTGDAQFYINTVDNVRLDSDYTVFAVVVERGMEIVDRMREGAIMRRVLLR